MSRDDLSFEADCLSKIFTDELQELQLKLKKEQTSIANLKQVLPDCHSRDVDMMNKVVETSQYQVKQYTQRIKKYRDTISALKKTPGIPQTMYSSWLELSKKLGVVTCHYFTNHLNGQAVNVRDYLILNRMLFDLR